MRIESYAGLIEAVESWLLRPDLTDRIETFIQNAEADLGRDKRCRRYREDTAFVIDSARVDLPSDFKGLDTLSFINTTSDPIRVGSPDNVRYERLARTNGGPPRVVSVTADNKLLVGPEPASSDEDGYTAILSYWGGFEALSDSNQSNWLLEEHPDIYLYATLGQSAPFLRDDPRLETWGALLERALEGLRQSNIEKHWSGPINRFPNQYFAD